MHRKSGGCHLPALSTCSILCLRPFQSWRHPCFSAHMIKSTFLLEEMEMWGKKLIQHPTTVCICDECKSEQFIYLPSSLLISPHFPLIVCLSFDILRNVLSYSAIHCHTLSVCVCVCVYISKDVSICVCVRLLNVTSWGPWHNIHVSKGKIKRWRKETGKGKKGNETVSFFYSLFAGL